MRQRVVLENLLSLIALVLKAPMTTEEMECRLKKNYPNSTVAVIDLTGTGDNFEVRISEPSFSDLSRIQQHKNIMTVFSEELTSGKIHALAIKTLKL